ncbi:MAG TPA: hypothetical protein DCM28_15305, partial [Phycisphaerales bacterium]|nr:hypothetical protein [Phycisphaerales bacterium]
MQLLVNVRCDNVIRLESGLSSIEYRPSIDGMRALAVASVLLFHLNDALLPGGFVGVDLFFVISGYLITSIIYQQCETGRFSLANFYQRRISRIFPVFFLVSLSILITAAVIYSSEDFSSAGALTTASALSLTNIKLMFQGNYFHVSADAQPFLHYWSLAVEEQFYMFLPLLLMLTHRLAISRKWMLRLLGVATVISFIACLVMTYDKPTWAFYLLPTRAWELLCGSLLAVYTSTSEKPTPKPVDRWLSLSGFAMVIISLFVVRESDHFPGYIAVLPVLGTAMLIGRVSDPSQWTERLLSNRVLVFVGKISYSLYLWHWPVYCFVDYRLYMQSTITRTLIKLILTVTLALLSYIAIEKPTRRYLNLRQHRWIAFTGFAIGVMLFAILGVSIRMSHGYVNASLASVAKGGQTYAISDDAPRVVLMGDSIGSMYGRIFKTLSEQSQVNVNVISVAADTPFPPAALYDHSIAFLQKSQPHVTVFAAAWMQQIGNKHNVMVESLESILQHSKHVILITQPPILPDDATREAFR